MHVKSLRVQELCTKRDLVNAHHLGIDDEAERERQWTLGFEFGLLGSEEVGMRKNERMALVGYTRSVKHKAELLHGVLVAISLMRTT